MPEQTAIFNKGSLFPEKLVTELLNQVRGKSALAQLSQQKPIPFNGQTEFIFSMDSDVDVVAESGKKSHGGITLTPKKIVPIKVEYGARVSDEFLYASEEERINMLQAFTEGFARKVARGLDLMALHGVNPRSGNPSAVIGDNHFDAVISDPVVALGDFSDLEGKVEEALDAIGHASGLAMNPIMRSELAKVKVNGVRQYPELAWGNAPESINGLSVQVNETVGDTLAYIGDFATYFKWGFAKNIPLKVIEYGDPDGSGFDLQAYNQVYLRAEAYVGWGILDASAFTAITTGEEAGSLTLTVEKDAAVVGATKIAVTEALGANNSYLIKKNGTVPLKGTILEAGKDGWVAYTEGAAILAEEGETIAIVEVVTATGAVVKGAVTDPLEEADIKAS